MDGSGQTEVVKEAIQRLGYAYDETPESFHINDYLTNVSSFGTLPVCHALIQKLRIKLGI